MNLFQLSLILAILLKGVTTSESGVAQDVIDALSKCKEESGFVSIRQDGQKWLFRNDLFDEVVTNNLDYICNFINQVWWAKKRTLAALFIKRPELVDKVLNSIKYDDNDLVESIIDCRSELIESPDNFLNAISKIKEGYNQTLVVEKALDELFKAKKYGSVISLVKALESRSLEGIDLDRVIRKTFEEGIHHGNKDVVKAFHEYAAITSEEYAEGLANSYKSNRAIFQLLLDHADKDDLRKVKKTFEYGDISSFRLRSAIKGAFAKAPSAGTRHLRLEEENARLAMKTLGDIGSIEGIQSLGQGKEICGIIASYLVGEEAWGKMTKKGEEPQEMEEEEEEQVVAYVEVSEDEGTEMEIEETVE
jgi:hypothetical protein